MYQFVRQCRAYSRIALLASVAWGTKPLVLGRGRGHGSVREPSSCFIHPHAYREHLALGETNCITFIRKQKVSHELGEARRRRFSNSGTPARCAADETSRANRGLPGRDKLTAIPFVPSSGRRRRTLPASGRNRSDSHRARPARSVPRIRSALSAARETHREVGGTVDILVARFEPWRKLPGNARRLAQRGPHADSMAVDEDAFEHRLDRSGRRAKLALQGVRTLLEQSDQVGVNPGPRRIARAEDPLRPGQRDLLAVFSVGSPRYSTSLYGHVERGRISSLQRLQTVRDRQPEE